LHFDMALIVIVLPRFLGTTSPTDPCPLIIGSNLLK
jgi:hypothetical protein